MTDRTLTDEDRGRVAVAEGRALKLVMSAILTVPQAHWGRDTQFIGWVCRLPWDHVTPAQRAHMERVAWRLRRYLPAHLAPKCNPDDPIVREMAANGR